MSRKHASCVSQSTGGPTWPAHNDVMKTVSQSANLRAGPPLEGRNVSSLSYRRDDPSPLAVYCSNTELLYKYHNYGLYPSFCLLFKTQLNSIGLSVPHRIHITSPRPTQQVNAIYRFVTMVYWYNYHHYPSFYLLFKPQLNSIGLSVPRRKHITSPLWAQQVNAICRFVTMVY
jgi:hypothetical protein